MVTGSRQFQKLLLGSGIAIGVGLTFRERDQFLRVTILASAPVPDLLAHACMFDHREPQRPR